MSKTNVLLKLFKWIWSGTASLIIGLMVLGGILGLLYGLGRVGYCLHIHPTDAPNPTVFNSMAVGFIGLALGAIVFFVLWLISLLGREIKKAMFK